MGNQQTESLLVRFMRRVHITDIEGSCWLWSGKPESNGYGRFHAGQGEQWRAHKLSYMLFKGEVPRGNVIRHSCSTPMCVNPDHLSIGTQAQNVQDMVLHGTIARGERCGGSKLTKQLVREIRERHAAGESGNSIAKTVPVSASAVMRVVKRKSWQHID